MRNIILAAAAVSGMLALGSTAASARDYRYCLQQSGDFGPGNCQYDTLRQCQASASGRYADCNINPRVAYGQYGNQRRTRGHYNEY